MKILVQQLKSGKMEIVDAPFPVLNSGAIIVRNNYSVISTGTEGKTVSDARKGYIAKAKARQQEVRQVIDSIQNNGFTHTYNTVMNKLEMLSALGYSCAGEIIAVGVDVKGFKVGDYVACAGSTAVHAEVVSVPENLAIKIPQGVELKHAAFTTIASIALQGIRQSKVEVGGTCVVIGLGLVGLLTMQLLHAAGIQAIGVDLDDEKVKLSNNMNSGEAICRDNKDLEAIISNHSAGIGADAVIITAGSSSTDPVNLAGKLCRQKGVVVIVGSVPTGFERDSFYKKELDLRMSCSYGPGRYDPDYEEKGMKYPVGYVRWTETRNMQAFLQLLSQDKLKINSIITHEFNFKDAPNAYKMIVDKSELFAGIVLKYDLSKTTDDEVMVTHKPENPIDSDIRIGFIGAGSFAQNVLLPNMPKNVSLIGVATSHSNTAKYVSDKFGFDYCTCVADEIFINEFVNTVFIATPHNMHGDQVIKALQYNKNVFTEKPLCMDLDELEKIKKHYLEQKNHLMVGFNRRFSTHVKHLKSLLNDLRPKAITYRINAGLVPPDHWIHNKDVGGGRIIGEVCHFIDLVSFIAGSKINTISAASMDDTYNLNDTLTISLGFKNGSVASLSYFSNGNKKVSKEYLEVYCDGLVAVLDDFKIMTLHGNKTNRHKLYKQDKGHKAEIFGFLDAVKNGKQTPIPFADIYETTYATFKVIESLQNRKTIIID